MPLFTSYVDDEEVHEITGLLVISITVVQLITNMLIMLIQTFVVLKQSIMKCLNKSSKNQKQPSKTEPYLA
jgi:hypothetical protein